MVINLRVTCKICKKDQIRMNAIKIKNTTALYQCPKCKREVWVSLDIKDSWLEV